MLTLVYLALALLGCGYIILASFLGHLSDSGDSGAHHTEGGAQGSYGVDGSGHSSLSADSSAAAAFHFPFFSPLALATLFGALGGYGLIAKAGFHVSDGISLALAIPAGLATAYLVTYASWRVALSSRGTSQILAADLAGATGEVTTPIPADGVGEVSTIVGGQRFTAPAREVTGRAVPRGAFVTIQQQGGATLLVAARESAPASGRGDSNG